MNGEIECSIMCRACMKVDGVLLPMYGDYTISKKNFPDKLAELASIQINKHDGLPSVLCAKCAYRTDAFHEFKLQVQDTEKKLRKMFQCPIRRSVSPKSELVCKNSDIDEGNNFVDVAPTDTKRDAGSYKILSREKIEEIDVKQIFQDCPSDEVGTLDSPNLVDDRHSGSIANDDFNVMEPILILETRQDYEEVSQIVKKELPDEIREILRSENLSYTLLYVSPEDETDLEPSKGLVSSRDSRLSGETNEATLDGRSYDENSPRECSRDSVNNSEEGDSRGGEGAESRGTQEAIPRKIMDLAPSPGKGRKKLRTKSKWGKVRKIEDSETDNFVDPGENLFGTLNDTITRIKEIRVEGSSRMSYQCTLCVQNYDDLRGVLSHTVETHVPSGGPFFCVVCEKDCSSYRELRNHVETHGGKYPYTCFVCGKAYSMKRYLKRHMSCHTDLPRHRCPKCGERFNQKKDLEDHLGRHIFSGPPFACSRCPRVFNHKGNYKRHLVSHLDPRGLTLPKYPCEICGKRFLNNRMLETHMRVHTGEKPYQCEVCQRSFSQRGNLLNHHKIHTNPRNYTCEVCGKSFNQRATLRDHGVLHTGEKPYVCNVCGLAFTFSAALRRHMWSHTDDKPFGCEICNARFVGKYDITRHMKIHSDRPKTRRGRNNDRGKNNAREERSGIEDNSRKAEDDDDDDDNDEERICFAEVLLNGEESMEIGSRRQEAEKENVDALLNLIEYG